jgi:hypothetical protein
MKSGIFGVVLSVLFVMGVIRLGHALERISPAQVFLSAPQCEMLRVPVKGDSCMVTGALSGRLDGGWVLTPASTPNRNVWLPEADITYSHAPGAWHLAYGGSFILPALLLTFMAVVLGNVWLDLVRKESSRDRA